MARRSGPIERDFEERTTGRSGVVRQVAELLSAETPVAELWNRCCEQILELCDAQCATIAICDPRGDYTLHVVDRISGVLISAPIDQESTLAQVLSCGETVVRYDEQNRCIGVPVRFGHVLLGAISVEGIADFDADLVSLLESCALYVAARIDYENVLQSSERYEELALSDGLTGIANRRRFDEALANEWRRAARERKPLAILMIDVDYFKKFNDEYGHDAGDVCLKQIARVIESCVRRPADIAARYGGEEFVILLPSTDQAGGVALGEALLAGVAELAMPHTESAVRHVTISIGVASTIPTAQTQAEVFLRAADRALYEAKHAGRNCLRVAAVRENLPVPATSFVGRKSELADVAHILETHPLLTITGAGGAGKTRLAIQLARDCADRFEDGAWFVDFADFADPVDPHSIAAALGAAISQQLPEGAVLPALTRALESKRALLVLDTCEHIVQPVAEVVVALLRACANLRIVATSREELGILGEGIYRLSTLSHPSLADVDGIATSDAVQLFAECAKDVKPDFEMTPANERIVADICRQVEGLPLAIELAAAHVTTLPPEQLVKVLAQTLAASSRRVGPRRQQTLTALIDWSYASLPQNERALFRRLSVFPATWTLDAATDICSGDGIEPDDIFDLVSALIRKSLVIDEMVGDDNRYRLLGVAREYARDKLAAAGELRRLMARHAVSYQRAVQEADPTARLPRRGVSSFGVGLDGGAGGIYQMPVPQALP